MYIYTFKNPVSDIVMTYKSLWLLSVRLFTKPKIQFYCFGNLIFEPPTWTAVMASWGPRIGSTCWESPTRSSVIPWPLQTPRTPFYPWGEARQYDMCIPPVGLCLGTLPIWSVRPSGSGSRTGTTLWLPMLDRSGGFLLACQTGRLTGSGRGAWSHIQYLI